MAHPIHPMLVHFPIVCWTLTTLGDIASIKFGEWAWNFSGIMLILGTISAIAAMITGLIEMGKIDEESQAINIANQHMKLVMVAWSFYASSLFMRLEGTSLAMPGVIEICLSTTGFLFLCIAGRLGGKLVFEYGVGVKDSLAPCKTHNRDSPH